MSRSHLTAIKRKKISVPMRWLKERGIFDHQTKNMDWGCGKGDDADMMGFFHRYDPHYFPEKPLHGHLFDIITCIYVLNVIPPGPKRNKIISEMQKYLKKEGRIYVAVRRDIKKPTFTKRSTEQHPVTLRWPVLVENSDFCIYVITKGRDYPLKKGELDNG